MSATATASTSMAPSTSSASRGRSTNIEPVIRNGFIIPSIRLTPPDSRPHKSTEVPDQDLSSNMLYIPLKTEEIGWEAGGLCWAPKSYAYPVVNLYGGDDDHIIGTYRGGPKGYSFFTITDPNFSVAGSEDCEERSPAAVKKAEEPRPRRETGDEIESDRGSSSSSRSSSRSSSASSSTSSGSKAAAPLAPIVTKPTPAPEAPVKVLEDAPQVASPAAEDDELPLPAPLTPALSASSSRRSSNSSEGDDTPSTGATTPSSSFCADDGKIVMGSKLTDALTALAATQARDNGDDAPTATTKLASRVGYVELAPGTMGTTSKTDKITKEMRSTSFSLDAAGPGEERGTWPAGRGTSNYSSAFADGSAYEENFADVSA